MKSIIIFALLLAGSFSAVQGEELKIGKCLLVDYYQKLFSCQTAFIHSLQKNPQSDCSVELEVFIDCFAKYIASCFDESSNVRYFEISLRETLTKDVMCDRAGLQAPVPVVGGNATLCSITYEAYVEKMNACSDKIVKMWQANRADKRLCSEYANLQRCQKNVIETDLACSDKDVNSTVEQYIAPYRIYTNPFCGGIVIPSSAVTVVLTVVLTMVLTMFYSQDI